MHAHKNTKQISEWSGGMGDEYVKRNAHTVTEGEELYIKDYDVSRRDMNKEFLGALDRDMSILEVGANVGLQLAYLHEMGFTDVLGIDVNRSAVKEAKRYNPEVDIIHASGFSTPFRDAAFELVYTSGVLIHIAPSDIADIMKEMARVSARYVWGFEYYAKEYTEVVYRGQKDLLWKTNFAELFMQTVPGLRLVKDHIFPMTDGVNASQMYLLEKKS